MSESQMPDVRIGDQVIIFNDETKTDLTNGWVTDVGSRTIDAYCINANGIDYRRDVVPETDPRIPILQQQEYFADCTRGIFRVTDSTKERRNLTTQLKALDTILQSLVLRVSALERTPSAQTQESVRSAAKSR
jgi:hypothetical protein